MYNETAIFRKEKGVENSPGNIFVNINKETSELYDEVEAENELGIVEELCDHVIYVINILEALGHEAKSNIDAIQERDTKLLDKASPSLSVSYILIALANYNLEKDIKALALIARIALKTLEVMGYKSVACVTEKAICINSREGGYDSLQDKWCKNPNQDPDTLYKPQYGNCKK
jgi:NTP pyrophosphatase (non-canonical NTP hydrolase)